MEPESFYHIYTHANGEENLFREERNYYFFLKKYAQYIETIADTFAYCLMPNHVHFLIRIKKVEEIEKSFGHFDNYQKLEMRISRQFANLFSSYTQSYNKVYDRMGSLFIPNFKRKLVRSDAYLTSVIHYIHSNPVHHGFTKNVYEWPYSSIHSLLVSKSTLLKREEVLSWFGGKNELINFHSQERDRLVKLDMEF